MKKLLTSIFFLCVAISASAQTSQGFRNPVIAGFHPDPSVCRVGDDFYLVNSSFQYFPGVPIYHSRDLVNWELIGNVLDRNSQLPLKGTSSWLGIYAPTIRYSDGNYYMITTNVGNGGNFMVTAKDPRGPWSEPIWLSQQGIDPSLYFEDGKCYMVSNPGDCIYLCEIDPVTGKQLTESKALWQGDGGRYPEGPHIYKKDGYYYLLISEGGTELAHHLTIARSRNIEGPYESNPNNPILTNCCRLGQSKQIQGTGHGDFVQAQDGSWWVVFLAYRNYGGSYHHLGRETYLAPMKWEENEWPVVNGNGTIDTLVQCQTLPLVPKKKAEQRTLFNSNKLTPDWVYLQNPISDNYKFGKNGVRLTAHGSLTENNQPTFLGRRQEGALMTVVTELNTASISNGCEAGLTVYQINDGHYDLVVAKDMQGKLCVKTAYTLKSIHGEQPVALNDIKTVKLRIRSTGENYYFDYSLDGKNFETLTTQSTAMVSTEVVGGFTGVTVGMFAQGSGSAEFGYFDYTIDD